MGPGFRVSAINSALGVEAAQGAVVDHLQVDAVPHQLADVVDAVLDHGGAAKERSVGGSDGAVPCLPRGGRGGGCGCPSTHRSSESPQAMTETFSGSPMGSSSSGRKTPEFPTSTHFFRPTERDGGAPTPQGVRWAPRRPPPHTLCRGSRAPQGCPPGEGEVKPIPKFHRERG